MLTVIDIHACFSYLNPDWLIGCIVVAILGDLLFPRQLTVPAKTKAAVQHNHSSIQNCDIVKDRLQVIWQGVSKFLMGGGLNNFQAPLEKNGGTGVKNSTGAKST